MIGGFSPTFLVIIAAVLLIAGAVNGLAGFGFALVGTMALATVIEPSTAVVLMIIPILSANVTLVSELSVAELQSCGRRFWPLVLAALVGTILGMVIIDSLPGAPVRVGLGLITLAFVLSRQSVVPVPSFGGNDIDREGTVVMLVIGGVSGLLFGATNVGVQLVAYLRSFDLSHGLFVSVVAMVFLGINAIRVGAAGALGLYPSAAIFGLSVAAVVPSVLGVATGRKLRRRVSSRHREIAVLGMLTVIGIRLVLGGLGIA
ncbi:sulfite exporter TauE/SafE family protein [Halonotius terrestris]|uniref:Probable membrane transporter protein n=1 Tax=Halonotius terrestris TaxID=2487750 RepID=A0A8J8PBV4_9EURY|nr:sulfite exporter TauE/SafE family protein [Halonotius terrestris]TQQ79932.1 sulfite exporter TauE/SafE family protein [Halonotius terrestris]